MQQDEHTAALKHGIKIHGRDAFMMLNKSLALSYGQFIINRFKQAWKKAFDKQISDLVKLTLVWNFRSDSTLWSMKTICYRT